MKSSSIHDVRYKDYPVGIIKIIKKVIMVPLIVNRIGRKAMCALGFKRVNALNNGDVTVTVDF